MAKYYDLNIPGIEAQRRLDLASHNVLAFDGILDVPVTASDELITAAESYQILYAPNGGRGEMLMSIGGTYYRNFRLQSSGKTYLDSTWYNEDGQIRKDRLFLNGEARDIYAYAAGAFGKVERDGTDGITPHIDTTKHWMIGEEDTGIVAEGKDGLSAYEMWLEQDDNAGKTVQEFLASLRESGFTTQAVTTRPTAANADPNTIYAVPDKSDDELEEPDIWKEWICVDGSWKLLAVHDGSGLSGALADIGDLKLRNEPIVFTTSKAINSFLKKLFVDISGYNGELELLNIYASCSASYHNFTLWASPTGGNDYKLAQITLNGSGRYCAGNTKGIYYDIELEESLIQAVTVSENTKLTTFAFSKAYDPRVSDGGFTESPILNKYIKKIWIEITSKYTGETSNVINKLTMYSLGSTYDGESGLWTNSFMIRPQVANNGFIYSSTDNDTEITFTPSATSNAYYGVVVHIVIDWESVRADSFSFTGNRTFLTPKAYNPVFWGTRLSDEVGEDSSIALSQKGAKTLSQEIASQAQSIENIGLINTFNYDGADLVDGWFKTDNRAKMTQTEPSQTKSWYCLYPIEVKQGDTIILKSLGGSQGRAWCLTDTSKYVLSKAEENLDTRENQLTLIAEEDGFLYINHQASPNNETGKNNFSLKITRNSIENTLKDVEDLKTAFSNIKDNAVSVAKIFNPKVDLKKSQLRVLDIGNSFTNNALGIGTDGSGDYIGRFVEAAGISLTDFCLYKAIRSSGSFKTWYDCYHDNDTVVYSVSRQIGSLLQTLNGNKNTDTEDTENNNAGDGSLFRSCLQDNTWDLILIHQASDYSTDDISVFEGNGNGGYLKEFVRLLKTLQPQAMIGFLFTHVSNRQTGGETSIGFYNMCKSVKQVCSSYGIDFIVPVGAAIENLRAYSHDETQELIASTTNNFSKDNHHLASGIAAYVAAATYFQSLLAPRYGVSVLGNTFNSTSETSSSSEIVNVTQTTAPIAQMCAILAVNDMWNINNPNGIIL